MSVDTTNRPGPPGAVTSSDGKRYYEFDDDTTKYWSVTTALKVMAKDGLPPWAAGLAATAAFDELPKVLVASRKRACGNTWSQCRQGRGDNAHDWRITCSTCPCRECQPCVTRWLTERHITTRDRRADEGRRAHDWIENWVINDREIAPHKDDIAPFVRAFLAFVSAYGLTPDSWLFAEATVVNRADEYAGTTDGVIRFRARATEAAAQLVAMVLQQPVSVCVAQDLYVDLVVDFKTKDDPPEKTVKFYDEVALQLTAYRFAPVVRIKRLGIEEPMPDTHGGLAVQLRPDMAIPRLCVVDEVTHGAFLHALGLYRWRIEFGTASVSSRTFKVPKEPVVPKPARAAKRAPAKTARQKVRGVAAADVPEPDMPPDAGRTLHQVAAAQGSTMQRIRDWQPQDPHPDSPYGDSIPF